MTPDDNITGDARELLDSIRDEIFGLPLLPQKQALELFALLDASLRDSIHLVMQHGHFVERYLADVIAEVAASVTHGRTVYENLANRGEEKELQGVYRKPSDVRFLESASTVIRMLAAYSDTNRDELKRHTQRMLSQIGFARLVYEDALEKFFSATETYVADAAESTSTHQRLHAGSKENLTRLAQRYTLLHDRMDAVERAVDIERRYLYHCCQRLARDREKQRRMREVIYRPYLRIVYKEARKHATNTQQVLDNLQNGAQGLLRALSCYNVHKKVSFSSYAHWWIRQAILYHIKDSSNFVKLPVTTWQTFTATEKKRASLACQTGEDDLESLAVETGQSVEKLKNVYESVRNSHVHSLDYEVDETGKMMLVDVISDPAEAEREHDHNVREDVRQRLAGLPDEQRFLLQLHYGILDMLEDKAPLTVRDVLQERIRQKLASAK